MKIRNLIFTVLTVFSLFHAHAQRIPDSSVTGTARATVGIDPNMVSCLKTGQNCSGWTTNPLSGATPGSMCGSVALHRDGDYENILPCNGQQIAQFIESTTWYLNPNFVQKSTGICSWSRDNGTTCTMYTSFVYANKCVSSRNITTNTQISSCPSNYTYGGNLITNYQCSGVIGNSSCHFSTFNGLQADEIDSVTTIVAKPWSQIYGASGQVYQASPVLDAKSVVFAPTCPSGMRFLPISGTISTSPGNNNMTQLYSCVTN